MSFQPGADDLSFGVCGLFVAFLELMRIAGYDKMGIESLIIPGGIVCIGPDLFRVMSRHPS